MTKKQAYKDGVISGMEAARYGDFTPKELENFDNFAEACGEICENKRQYVGHPGYDFNNCFNRDDLWDRFDDGEAAGILKGWQERQRQRKEQRGKRK